MINPKGSAKELTELAERLAFYAAAEIEYAETRLNSLGVDAQEIKARVWIKIYEGLLEKKFERDLVTAVVTAVRVMANE